jgi:ADP-ribose pyrophosphatase YjhB (NUDIX family)
MMITESAGGVVVNSRGEVLVVSQNGDSWSLPKGHIEEGEDALSAARREILEESGAKDLTLVKEFLPYTRHRIARGGVGDDLSVLKIIRMFLFTTRDLTLMPRDPANPEARYVLPEEVEALLTHEKDREFFHAVRKDLKNLPKEFKV